MNKAKDREKLLQFRWSTNCVTPFSPEYINNEVTQHIEIYINAPIEVCEQRDVKGLYKKARKGEIKGFTGIDSPYEAPLNPALEIRTDKISLEEAVVTIYDYILPHIRY